MAKRRRETDSDSDAIAAPTLEYNTVFVDTSLDTHLAMLVSNSDTVSDLKKKMALEHMQCFPNIGEIRIHSLKVKRKGNFYHLPDVMLVWSAFHSVKGNWYLSVDASGTSVGHLNQNISELGTSNGVKTNTTNVDDNSRFLLSDVNQIQALPMSLAHGVIERNVVPEMVVGFKDEKSVEKTAYFPSNNHLDENDMGTDPRAKKKRKLRHAEDSHGLLHASIPEIVGPVKEGPEGTVLDEQQGKPMSEAAAEVSGMRYDPSGIGDRVAIEGTSSPATEEKSNIGIIVNSESLLGSDRKKEEAIVDSTVPENLIASKMESDVPTENSGRISVKVPDLSAKLMDATGAMVDANSDGNKRKKRKSQKTPAKIQDKTDTAHSRKVESNKPYTESHKSEEKDGDIGLSENHDHEVIKPSNSNALDHSDPDLAKKETSNQLNLLDANAVTEPEISSVSKKKEKEKKKKKKEKRGEKSADTNLKKSGIEQTENGISHMSGLLGPSTNHILEETDKEESIHTEKEVHTKLLDNSTVDASEKAQTANRNEADFVTLPQTKRTLEDAETGKKRMEKETQSSAGNGHADFPSAENEKLIVELNKVEKDGKNTENKGKKDKKRKKKRNPTASDIQENMPVKDQNVGIEVLTTAANSTSFVNPEHEGSKISTSPVMSREDEEKPDKMHENAVSTDDPAKTSENKGEGINFKQYFLPDQHQEKVDSSDKVKTATKSNKEKKTRKKVKENGSPYISTSTELQNPIKSSENQETQKTRRARTDIGKMQGDSAQNSDWDEIIPSALKKDSRVSGNGVKDISPNDMSETTIQRTKDNFPGKRGNKRSQSGLNSTNKMEMRTPQTKSLLSKSGSIFPESSDESSGDENGTVHSGAKTRTPSDGSSLSGYSEGESDLSQDSTRNGSSDARGRSAGGKSMSKLDLSGSKDMTMDMILRSSKRFKKAKLQASQNEVELEPMEFVPESQPV